jgi:CMP-N,N'-diacetyllegionaminic acid synthase
MGIKLKRICTICARGGSKGVKGKNIRALLDKPLIAYSIEQAMQSKLFDAVAVSSDSELILDTAKAYGVQYLIKRPAELATDTAAKLPVIRHCVREVEKITGGQFDTIVDLDATSPLRLIKDIVATVDKLESEGAANVITGMPARRSPYFNLVEVNDLGHVVLSKPLSRPIVRRQDAPLCYDMNASIYAWKNNVLFSESGLFNAGTRLFVMPEERSIDIDSEMDFRVVEMLMRERLSALP